MSLIYVKNERNPAVSMQCWYLFLLVQNLHSCVQTLIFVCKLAFCRENPAADIVRVVPKKESNRVLDNTNKGTKTDAYGCQRPPPRCN